MHSYDPQFRADHNGVARYYREGCIPVHARDRDDPFHFHNPLPCNRNGPVARADLQRERPAMERAGPRRHRDLRRLDTCTDGLVSCVSLQGHACAITKRRCVCNSRGVRGPFNVEGWG